MITYKLKKDVFSKVLIILGGPFKIQSDNLTAEKLFFFFFTNRPLYTNSYGKDFISVIRFRVYLV